MSGARNHHKYSGSNAHRFSRCSGQIAFCANAEEIETQHQKDGTFAHLALNYCFRNNLTDASYLLGAWSHGGRWVAEEETDAIQHALDYVQQLRAEHPDLVVYSEFTLRFPQNIVPRDDAGGVLDIFAYSAAARHVWVVDYKHGAGGRVEADDNYQLRYYLCCVLGDIANIHADKFTGVIIQPRHWAYTCAREQNFLAADLIDFMLAMHDAIVRCETETVFTPGSWCNHCAKHALCPAAAKQATTALYLIMAEGDPNDTPDDVAAGRVAFDVNRLAQVVALTPSALQWFRAVGQLAEAKAKQGVHVPGFKIVRGQTARRYRPDMTPRDIALEAFELSNRRLGTMETMPQRLVPLTKLEAMFVAKAREAAPPEQRDKAAQEARQRFAFLTLKDAGDTFSLVPESDPRPAYAPSARDDFAGVNIKTFKE